MRVAVLKNRLLQMTNGQFDQSRYGEGSMVSILGQIPDVVDVVSSTTLRLADSQVESASEPEPGKGPSDDTQSTPTQGPKAWRGLRIRDDLWKAIVHWDDGSIYIWDSESAIARAKEITDPDGFELPTISRDDLAHLRNEFAYSRSASETPHVKVVLEEWAKGPGGASDLPRIYRGPWLEYLKNHVYDLVLHWFKDRGIPLPDGLLLRAESRGEADPAVKDVVMTRVLRSFLIDAIGVMTYEQMASLQVPAEVLLKIRDRA